MKLLLFALAFLAVVTMAFSACKKSSDCGRGKCCVRENGREATCEETPGLKNWCTEGAYDAERIYDDFCPCEIAYTCTEYPLLEGSLTIRDTVRECLEKDPLDRSDEDIRIILEYMQHLPAFANMTLTVRRALCAVMVFVAVEKAGVIVMNDGEELDSCSVIVNGLVEIELADGSILELQIGDSFGITPTMEKMYQQGVMRTKSDDCQFVCVAQSDYYRILHLGEENIKKHEEDGQVVLVTEQRPLDGNSSKGHITIRVSAKSCRESSDCPEGTCCMGYTQFTGRCKPLGIEGEKCLVDARIFPTNEIHVAACPCSEDLLCQGRDNKGKTENSGTCQSPPSPPSTNDLPDEE